MTAVLHEGTATDGLPVIDGRRVAEPDRPQFDFWLGSWRVHQLDGEPVRGRNEVAWTLDGKVLWEQFSAGRDPFTGWSFSVPVVGRGWVQTWVDNNGAYLDFAGGWLPDAAGGRMVLERSTGRMSPARQRMTWHSISARSFVWEWAAQATGHPREPWDVMWRLRYDRR
jgi:hypothetical protein